MSPSQTPSTSALAPPPTSNNLGPVQRVRAMRSSRKLGAVLGTTPFVLESCGSSMPARLRSPSPAPVVSHAHTRSLQSAPSREKHLRRQGSVFESSRVTRDLSPRPSLAYDSASSVESLPLVTPDASEEELVPPDVVRAMLGSSGTKPHPLVLRLDPVPLDPTDPRITIPLTPLSAKTQVPPSPVTPVELSRAEARRRKMARVVRTLGESVPPALVFQPTEMDWPENAPVSGAGRTRTSSTARDHRRRSASLSGATSINQRLLELPAPVFSSSARAPEGQRWVGAWNRQNIGQVQRELRALRRR
ncbi:hypothetical protein BC834DRAFT_874476 [Gloeopeniophorella convolvens]|nr:hypothetical protein BC834DRAFT_874476 [Gloeopeniophorella convolvens]